MSKVHKEREWSSKNLNKVFNMSKFWKLKNSVEGSGSEIYIEGAISSEEWWGDEATPSQLREELKAISGNKITVVINSGGGDVWAGLAMYNALRELDAEITVRVDGLAASIASVIAMAGDKIIMSPGSMLMIHKASAWAGGDSEDLAKVIEMLETVEESIVPIYADRSGLSREEVQEMMNAETWLSAEEAVEKGFADEVAKKAVKEVPTDSFSGVLALSMSATKASAKVALEHQDEANEVVEETEKDDDSQTTESDKDVVSTTPDDGEAKVETEEEPEVAEVEATPENKATKEKETQMSKQEEIAQTQVIEPKNQAKVESAPVASNYLKTDKAMEDFAGVLKANAGKTVADVKSAWESLRIKNGVTNPETVFPEPFVTEIKDQLEASQIYNLLNHTGLDALKVAWDASDPLLDTSRAGQHNPEWENGESEVDKTKDQEIITLDDRELEPDYIYKYIVLDKKTVRKQRSSGALLRYILRELPAKIIAEIERAVMIGDGRANGSKRKITSFISVKADATAGNTFASTYVPLAGETKAESVAKATDLLRTDGSVYLVAKKGFSTEARFEKNSDGDLLYPIGTRAQDIFEVQGIIEPTWFTDATDPDNDAYLVVFSAYDTVGDNSIESFTNFRLETNENEYLQEIFKGGGLTGIKSAVAISASTASS